MACLHHGRASRSYYHSKLNLVPMVMGTSTDRMVKMPVVIHTM